MNGLTGPSNLGPAPAAEPVSAGVDSPARLRALGAGRARDRIREVNSDRDCASCLLAPGGVVRGIRWRQIDPAERDGIAAYARSRRHAR